MTDEPKDVPEPETNPDGSPKRDLRYSAHDEGTVQIERNLDGSGRLARGDRTNMSVLKFSSRHASRDTRDPDFEFRPAPTKTPPVPPDPAAPPLTVAEPATPTSLGGRLKRLFGF